MRDERSAMALGSAARVASRGAQELLEEVAGRIRWEKHLNLTRRVFSDLVACAIADELEGADDESVSKLLKSLSLDEARKHPEYRAFRQEARSTAQEIAAPDQSYEEWLEEADAEARRVMRRSIAGRTTIRAAQAAEAIIDRKHPKPRRDDGGPKGFFMSPEQVEALRAALAIDVTPKQKGLAGGGK